MVDIFYWSYPTNWPEQNFKSLSVSLSVGSFVNIVNNFKYICSLLREVIETFNTCLSHYFGADEHFMVMMMIVTVILIWLGTIVTWLSCSPLVLFLNKITMGILTGHRHSYWHRKSVISVSLATISCNLLDYRYGIY